MKIHESAHVDDGAKIGEGTSIWQNCIIQSGAVVGDNCNIGANVYIEKNVMIGNGVKIKNNVALYEGAIIKDDVFLGPNCVFTNVINPRSFINRKHEFRKTIVNRGATIGANATIVCGVEIGEYAFVAAGAVVTKDVAPHSLVMGNPGRVAGYVCICGCKLNKRLECTECHRRYIMHGQEIVELVDEGNK